MKVLISAGGTGGHIYPAIAIINKIKEKEPNSKFLYVGTLDRMEKDIIPNLGIDYIGIKMTGVSKNISKLIKFIYYNIKEEKHLEKEIKKFNPDVVIGVGGYVTVPVIMAAKKLGIKTVLHEQNSIPGKANKFLSKYADLICTSMESSNKYFKHKNIIYTGNPRGEETLKIKKANKKDYGLSVNKKLVLITTGSLGASTVNNKLKECIKEFSKKNYEVLLVTGKESYDEMKKYSEKNVIIMPYVENLNEVLKVTDLIITRAGATIISEITTIGVPSILIPSPYVANNHQEINAKDIESNNAGIVIKEQDLTKEILLDTIDKILDDEEMYKKLATNAKKLGTPHSATKIYEEIKKILK